MRKATDERRRKQRNGDGKALDARRPVIGRAEDASGSPIMWRTNQKPWHK